MKRNHIVNDMYVSHTVAVSMYKAAKQNLKTVSGYKRMIDMLFDRVSSSDTTDADRKYLSDKMIAYQAAADKVINDIYDECNIIAAYYPVISTSMISKAVDTISDINLDVTMMLIINTK